MKKLKTISYVLLLAMLVLTGSAQAQEQTSGGNAKGGPLSKVGSDLASLYEQHRLSSLQGIEFALSATAIPMSKDTVVIEAVASGDAVILQSELEKLGLKHPASAGRMVSGLLPITAIPQVAELDSLQFARPAYAIISAGNVTTQGDAAMRSDDARDTFGVDGAGVRVGVLSDSADCLGGLAVDVKNDDLPGSVFVLQDHPDWPKCLETGTDEGRAVMQVVHDVAPGASLWFITALGGQPALADAIKALGETIDADVIVDDIIYLAEPMFQDGVVAQAVDKIVGDGVAYFSSTGNSARNSYESPFSNSGSELFGSLAHDYDPGPAVDIKQSITIPLDETVHIVLQWDEPYFSVSGGAGSTNDLDIFLLDPSDNLVAVSADANVGGDPVEVMTFDNTTGGTEFNLVIERDTSQGGADPGFMKYVIFGDAIINEYPTDSGSLYGHANADGAEAVGAAFYAKTPELGIAPPLIEPFSSAGPTPILFDTSGNRLVTPINRNKPEIVAPDGGNTTFLGSDISLDSDGFPNFFGTSASAAHAAGVAALLLDADPTLGPDALYSILEGTAIDMDDPHTPNFDTGFDFGTGHGLIQAYNAVLAIFPADLEIAKSEESDPVLLGEELTFTLTVTNNGPASSTSATLTDTLHFSYSFISATSTSASILSQPEPGESGSVVFDLGELAVGQIATTTIVVIPTQVGTFPNTATVGSVQQDDNLTNNVASEDTTVVAPDLAIAKTDSPDPVTAGSLLTYTIAVSNIGSATSSDVILTDNLPVGVAFVSATSTPNGFCSDSGGTVTCELGDLGIGQTATTTVAVIPSAAGTITNSASVTSGEEDLDPSNNSDSEDTLVIVVQTSSDSDSGSSSRRRSAAATSTPVPVPVPTSTPVPPDVPPPPSPPTPVPPGVVEDAPLDEAVQIVEDAPLDEAVEIIRAISLGKKVAILSQMDRDKAAAIMEELPLDELIEIVNLMEVEDLLDILPRLSPDKLFSVPPEFLLGLGVPVEQIIGEIAPVPHPDLGRPIATQDSPTKTTYLVPETRAAAWVIMIGSPAPLDLVLGKFTRDLNSIRVIVEDLNEPPPTVPKFPPDVVLNSMFTINLPDSNAEDISVAHVTLFVEKDWVEENDIHKWSIEFNRLDEEINAWVPHPSKRVREDEERIYYSVGIPGFSIFAVTGSAKLPEQIFQVTDLQISPESPTSGQSVSIIASVTNTTSERAVYPASLWIDSTIEDSEHILVEAGETAQISFTVSRPTGAYDVRIDRLFGDFVVFPEIPAGLIQEPEPTPMSVILAAVPTVTPSPVPTPTPTVVPTPSPTATPVPTATVTPLVVASLAPTPIPPSPTPTPPTLEASVPPTPQGDGNRNIIIAVAVAVGVLATAGIVGFFGYNFRRNSGPE